MTAKINLHTHTTFCDGKNTPEEMVISAIKKGFTVLGFSGHSMFPFAENWHIAPREFPKYLETIRSLAKKYQDKITILCGFEADFIPSITMPDKNFYKELNPDYLIGSVHYVVTKYGHYSVDDKVEYVKQGVDKLYNSDGKKAVCDYFEAQRYMLRHGNFEIWGHPDLIRKRNGILHFFNEDESWYKEQLELTVKEAKKAGVIAEINTGAIARKAMDDFYPSASMLELLYKNGIPVMVNSDAHNADDLDCAFEQAYLAAKKAGYKELTYPIAGSLQTIKL